MFYICTSGIYHRGLEAVNSSQLISYKRQSDIRTYIRTHGNCYNYGYIYRMDLGLRLVLSWRVTAAAMKGLVRLHEVWRAWCAVTCCDNMGCELGDCGGDIHEDMRSLPAGDACSLMCGPC